MKIAVELRPVADLVPYARNARKHSEAAVARLVSIIGEVGWTSPILLDDDGIVAGHKRRLAALSIYQAGGKIRLPGGQELPAGVVPTLDVTGWTEAQRRAYILADNQTTLESEWDGDMLRLELSWLEGSGEVDMALTGFDGDALARALGFQVSRSGKADPDQAPVAPVSPASRPGDVWLLDGHRVMCGDSTDIEQVKALCGGVLADLWLTDPPYNVAYEGKTKDALKIENDSMSDDDFRAFLRRAYIAADASMRPGASFYIWHADSEGYNFRGAAQDAGWKVRQCLIWMKQTMVMGRQDYHWKHEPCLYGWKDGAAHFLGSDRKQTTILEFDRPSRNSDHPTMKPVNLFAYQMLNNTSVGDVVLDSFAGSGTTVIAAEMHGRISRAMEMDPRYCDVIVKRWQDFTGKVAVLADTGETFDEVKLTRGA